MMRRTLRRLTAGAFTGWIVAIVAYGLLALAPGDPAESIAAARVGASNVTPALIEEVRHEQRLDRPPVVRLAWWVWRALHGDLGRSAIHGRPVAGELVAALPATLQLAAASTALAVWLSVVVALTAVLYPGATLDRLLAAATTLGVSFPAFWLGQLLILVFAVRLGWLPATDVGGGAALVLPALTTALPSAAVGTRLLRGALLDVLAQPYIGAARSRGIGVWRLHARHALRNAFVQNLPLAGVQFAGLLEGTVIVESLFGRAGCGRLLVEAVFARDAPMMLGCLVTMGTLCVLVTTASRVGEVLLVPATDARRAA